MAILKPRWSQHKPPRWPPKSGFSNRFGKIFAFQLELLFWPLCKPLHLRLDAKVDAQMGPEFPRTPPNPAEGPRKNNALRKKWSEGYIAKEKWPQGTLIRKLIFLQPLRPKGYMAKGRKHYKTRLKLKSSSFLSEGYIDKGLFRKGISIRNFRRVYR